MQAKESIETLESEKAELALERAVELIDLFTQGRTLDGWLSHSPQAMETQTEVSVDIQKVITEKAILNEMAAQMDELS